VEYCWDAVQTDFASCSADAMWTDSTRSYSAAVPLPVASCSAKTTHPGAKHLSEAYLYSVAAERLSVMRSGKLRLLMLRRAAVSRWCCQDAAHRLPVAVSHSPQRGCFVPWQTEGLCFPRLMADAELRERCWLESLFGCSPLLPEAPYT
jgi:hypothetical protein